MGNCLRHQSPMQWAGDDWGSPENDGFLGSKKRRCGDSNDHNYKAMKMEEQVLLGQKSNFGFTSSSASSSTTTEVKVKITKKQLEELLSKVDVKELSVGQVLAQLMNVSDRYEAHQRSWRPALQSIPEVN